MVAVSLEPTWRAFAARRRLRTFVLLASPLAICLFAVYVFPLAPAEPARPFTTTTLALIAAVGLALAAAIAVPLARMPAATQATAGAVLCGLALLGAALVLPDKLPRGNLCPDRPVNAYLKRPPEGRRHRRRSEGPDVRAGHGAAPRRDLDPARAVLRGRLLPRAAASACSRPCARTTGGRREAIADLMTRYGATHLWVRRDAVQKEMADGGVRWRGGQLPYGRYVRRLLREGEPAVLDLPLACRRWHLGGAEVYDIRCIARLPDA